MEWARHWSFCPLGRFGAALHFKIELKLIELKFATRCCFIA
jgi:hypothetical protein